tara:strand:+ start:69 stop:230 length:162 start_codon:yes stop_codon:yes gene_type:complete
MAKKDLEEEPEEIEEPRKNKTFGIIIIIAVVIMVLLVLNLKLFGAKTTPVYYG